MNMQRIPMGPRLDQRNIPSVLKPMRGPGPPGPMGGPPPMAMRQGHPLGPRPLGVPGPGPLGPMISNGPPMATPSAPLTMSRGPHLAPRPVPQAPRPNPQGIFPKGPGPVPVGGPPGPPTAIRTGLPQAPPGRPGAPVVGPSAVPQSAGPASAAPPTIKRPIFHTGVVHKWVATKGYGFIHLDYGGMDTFFHLQSVKDSSDQQKLAQITTGSSPVQFELEFQNGRLTAINVEQFSGESKPNRPTPLYNPVTPGTAVTQVNAMLDALTRKVMALRNKVKELSKDGVAVERRRVREILDFRECKSALEKDLMEQLVAERQQKTAASHKNSATQLQLSMADRKVKTAELQVKALEAEKMTFETKLKDRQMNLNQCQTKVVQSRLDVEKAQRDVAKVKEECGDLKKKIDKQKKSADESSKESQKRHEKESDLMNRTIRRLREDKSKLEERLTKCEDRLSRAEDRLSRSNQSKPPGGRADSRSNISSRRDEPRSTRRRDESRSATSTRHETRSDSSSSRRQSAAQKCRAKRPRRDGDNSDDMDLDSDQEQRAEELLTASPPRLKRVHSPADDMVDPTPPVFQSVKPKAFSEPAALAPDTQPAVTTYATRGAEADYLVNGEFGGFVQQQQQTVSAPASQSPVETVQPQPEASPQAYRVERIMNRRTSSDGGLEYMVQWAGFEDTTWEPMNGLRNCLGLIREFEQNALSQNV